MEVLSINFAYYQLNIFEFSRSFDKQNFLIYAMANNILSFIACLKKTIFELGKILFDDSVESESVGITKSLKFYSFFIMSCRMSHIQHQFPSSWWRKTAQIVV